MPKPDVSGPNNVVKVELENLEDGPTTKSYCSSLARDETSDIDISEVGEHPTAVKFFKNNVTSPAAMMGMKRAAVDGR